MRALFVIAGKDLRQRFRDRSAIALAFVAPLAVAGLMSFAFQGAEDFHFRLGVVDEDRGPLAATFIEVLESRELADLVEVEPIDTEPEAAERVEAGSVTAAIVIPEGFSGVATGGDPVGLSVLGRVDDDIAAQVSGAIASSFVARMNTTRLGVTAAVEAGAPPEQLAELAAALAGQSPSTEIENRPIGAEPLRPISYFAPAMAIFFLLFAVAFASSSFYGEVRDGTLDRMAAAPIRPTTVLAGKALSVLVYGTASLGTMAVVTSVVFGADWGHPLAAAAVCLAMVVAVVALTALVIAVARTDRQANALSSMIVFGLALLGGNFFLVSAAPPLMRRLALLTPNGWALRAFTDLSTTSRDLAEHLRIVAGPVAAILVFSAVVASIAGFWYRRTAIR